MTSDTAYGSSLARGRLAEAPCAGRQARSLARLQPRRLDDLLGAHAVVGEELAEFLGRVEHRLERALDHVAVAEGLLARSPDDLAAQLVDQRPRCAGGRQQPEERARVVAGEADLAERRDVRNERR